MVWRKGYGVKAREDGNNGVEKWAVEQDYGGVEGK